jgi:Sister chromatid cohesion protein Dcc1
MSPTYTTNLLDLILATAMADSLPLDSLSLSSLLAAIGTADDRPECIQALLHAFSSPATGETYRLDQSAITKWYGLRTLSQTLTPLPTARFLTTWSLSLPASIDHSPDLTLLRGNYYQPTPGTVQYLPSEELATSPQNRLGQLLAIKERWEVGELMPLMRGCVGPEEGWEKRVERECAKWARIRSGFVVKR